MSRPQNSEVEQFLQRLCALPEVQVSLDDVLKPSLEIEHELRQLFADDKTHERLADPHVGLVDVFDAPDAIRVTRARIVQDDQDLSAHYIMPLTKEKRRLEGPCMLDNLSDFKKNWDVFTEGSLSQLLDWKNVVAAGGSVLACLEPLPEAAKGSRRNMRKHYHAAAYPSSDIDLFLWGLSLEETEAKIKQIYEAVRDAIPQDVTCVRTKNTVSIISQYPYRTVQIILRQYTSPAQVLMGFDIDAGCCLYDGSRVYASPRAIIAMMRQANTIDPSRRSSSYEVRLSKYAIRGFEVYYPDLKREDIDPTIYERSLTRIEGLARLLVLEKFANTDVRYTFLDSRRTLRGRPNPLRRNNKRHRRLQGDLKADVSLVEMSEYDVQFLHIPYGPGWDARRIDKLVYQTDLSMNSTFNPKNKGRRLHRHPAFFGTAEECMEDCCGTCPEPDDEDERKAQEEEDQYYIRGRISFIPIDYGRKSSPGAHESVDASEWIAQAYIGPTERFFAAIAACDREAVSDMLMEVDLNRRDHVGRTPLHMAILSGAPDIACDLVHAGARITAQMVDGRTSLHLAAQLDQLEVVRTVLERSAINEQALVAGDIDSVDSSDWSRISSDDDWSDVGSPTKKGKKAVGDAKPHLPPGIVANGGDLPEDEDVPDVFNVNGVDWDLNFTPLCHAILFSSLPIVEALLSAGADANFVSLTNDQLAVLPLALTILTEDEDRACGIAEKLVLAGASSSAANARGTIFHRAVAANKLKLVTTFLHCDPNATKALNSPFLDSGVAISPLYSAVYNQNYSMLAVLLAHGAKVVISQEDIDAVIAANGTPHYMRPQGQSYPVETALVLQDDMALLLVSLGAQVDFSVGASSEPYFGGPKPEGKVKLHQWIRSAIDWLSLSLLHQPSKPPSEAANVEQEPLPGGWSTCLANLLAMKRKNDPVWTPEWTEEQSSQYMESEKRRLNALKDYLIAVGRLIPGFSDTESEIQAPQPIAPGVTLDSRATSPVPSNHERRARYYRLQPPHTMTPYGFNPYGGDISSDYSPAYLDRLYDDLFEACFAGSNEKIQQMFLPEAAPTTIDTSIFYISVHVADPEASHKGTGITPLVAAIAGRHWDTARLILTIAGLQYKPVEAPARFTTVGIRLDEDDHNYHDGSDVTVDEAVAKFVDITKKSTTAQCNVPPDVLLSASISWISDKGKSERGSPLVKAVYDDDFEAFVNIANLYKYSPRVNLDVDPSPLAMILSRDRTEMLDEYIRRTGVGIDVPEAEETGDVPLAKDKNTIYTGLDVHGKKRLDLARQNDPNVVPIFKNQIIPLLWQAAAAGASQIVDYLAGDRPLSAYRFYAFSNSDSRARALRLVPDLEKTLPELLGWTITPLCETPLFAGIQSKRLPLIKKLLSNSPRMASSALHERVKGLGVNTLMFAIYLGCDTDLVDFLLGQSVSPDIRDETNGFNIFHYMCHKNHLELLHHLLYKLPRDVVEALLCQQSKGRLETPLHLAVKGGNSNTVFTVLEFSTASLHLRDADGWTALHAAVQKRSPAIIGRLINAAPAGLGAENGVGHTPLEMAFLQELIARTHRYKSSPTKSWDDPPTQLPPSDDEGALLRWRNPRLGIQLLAFAERFAAKYPPAAHQEQEDQAAGDGNTAQAWWDTPSTVGYDDRAGALRTVRGGVAYYAPVRRQLVRLEEVQASVEASLARAQENPGAPAVGGGVHVHAQAQAQALQGSLVYQKMHMNQIHSPWGRTASEYAYSY
ncbi:Ankyrin repeat protein [Mycena venus]|uniref:Ankyrin repeat protein n=1 Tax=Mycena venus TaxID=2733690 RepID=A0A8H6XUD8_9AGAR|nr:Ankyrin repeat protein [Mycena venus]